MEHRGRHGGLRRFLAVTAIALMALFAGASAEGAGRLAVSGRLLSLPRHQRGLSVIVEAVSLDDGEAVAAEVVKSRSTRSRSPRAPI